MAHTIVRQCSVILGGRRFSFPANQAQWLATLISRPGQIVMDSDLVPLSWHQITSIRSRLLPHGFAIFRVWARGCVLVETERMMVDFCVQYFRGPKDLLDTKNEAERS